MIVIVAMVAPYSSLIIASYVSAVSTGLMILLMFCSLIRRLDFFDEILEEMVGAWCSIEGSDRVGVHA